MDHGRLRPARMDEAAALEDLMREASLIWDDHREDLLAHPDAIEVPPADLREGRVRVHEVDGVLTGFATVLPLPDGSAELDALFVRPAHMRHGIGARLVEDAARRARDGGALLLVVTANPRAEAFYARCGFRTVGEAPTRFGPAIRMYRDLAPPVMARALQALRPRWRWEPGRPLRRGPRARHGYRRAPRWGALTDEAGGGDTRAPSPPSGPKAATAMWRRPSTAASFVQGARR